VVLEKLTSRLTGHGGFDGGIAGHQSRMSASGEAGMARRGRAMTEVKDAEIVSRARAATET
jgi:hypothetical protein